MENYYYHKEQTKMKKMALKKITHFPSRTHPKIRRYRL